MSRTWSGIRAASGHALRAAVDLVLPSSCAACHAVAAGPLCRRCVATLRSASRGVGPAGPHPAQPSMPPCWAGARFEGALRLAITAYKDEGRRDLRDELARLLGAALTATAGDPALRRCLWLDEDVLVVPVPASGASRRRRGDDPVGALARSATAAVNVALDAGPVRPDRRRSHPVERPAAGFVVAPALVHTRRVADQAHLGRQARARNLAGSMAVGAQWHGVVRGATCVVVDDVVTTGATLIEAARALRDAGARHVVAATCATTPKARTGPALVALRTSD